MNGVDLNSWVSSGDPNPVREWLPAIVLLLAIICVGSAVALIKHVKVPPYIHVISMAVCLILTLLIIPSTIPWTHVRVDDVREQIVGALTNATDNNDIGETALDAIGRYAKTYIEACAGSPENNRILTDCIWTDSDDTTHFDGTLLLDQDNVLRFYNENGKEII